VREVGLEMKTKETECVVMYHCHSAGQNCNLLIAENPLKM
jgi:hypothetical protein